MRKTRETFRDLIKSPTYLYKAWVIQAGGPSPVQWRCGWGEVAGRDVMSGTAGLCIPALCSCTAPMSLAGCGRCQEVLWSCELDGWERIPENIGGWGGVSASSFTNLLGPRWCELDDCDFDKLRRWWLSASMWKYMVVRCGSGKYELKYNRLWYGVTQNRHLCVGRAELGVACVG